MKLFAIGDLHLSFSQEKPMDKFGANWEDHQLKIEKNWRESVSDDDLVFIPGDISWAMKLEEALPDLAWLDQLPGTKLLLRGNHDYWWTSVSKLRALYGSLHFIQNDSYDAGCAILCGVRGWLVPSDTNYKAADDEKIYTRELLRLRLSLESAVNLRDKRLLEEESRACAGLSIADDAAGYADSTGDIKSDIGKYPIICGLHFPPTDGKYKSEFTKLLAEFGVSTLVYGHLHGQDAFGKGIKGEIDGIEYRLVSADYLDFKPALIYSDD